jgi:hypothetical protein
MLTEENWAEGAKLEHTPQKSLRCLEQEIGISEYSFIIQISLFYCFYGVMLDLGKSCSSWF